MQDREPTKSAPNYTNAALAMGLVNLIWVFVLIWLTIGYWAVLLAGLGLNTLISRLEDRMQDD